LPNGPALPLLLILGFGLLLRIVFWYGVGIVDSFAYADSAASIARGLPAFDRHIYGNLYYTQYIRFSLTVPAALLYRFFGPGEVVSTLVPIAASLGIAVVSFELARRVAGNGAGLVAAFLACIFPVNVINSTQFMPDTMMAFFCGVTMLLFLVAFEGEHSRRTRLWLYFATGVAWACAFYGKQTSVALAIPFVVLVVARRRFHRESLAGLPGALLVVAAVQVLLLSLGGSFLEDVRTVIAEGRNSQPGALRYTDIDFTYIKDLLHDPMFIPTTFLAGAGLAFAVAAEGFRGFVRGRSFPLLVLAAGQYLYFEFLMRLPGLYSWWKEPRYVLSMLIPMFALAGIGLVRWTEMLRGRARRTAAIYLAGGLLFATATTIQTVRNDHTWFQEHRTDQIEIDLAAAIGRQPPATVFTWDDDLARYLSFHLGLDRTSVYERFRNQGLVRNRFDAAGRELVEPGALVAVSRLQDQPGMPTAAPPEWQPVWAKPGVMTLYRVPEDWRRSEPVECPAQTITCAPVPKRPNGTP
jgi:4-amino-4-deoxy-L-arabinose transferase-like glycosyltransferase